MAHLAHVGDSRAYLYRNGRLRRLTTDHSQAQKMIDAGMLTPEQALDHPASSILEQSLGPKPTIEVDIARGFRVKEGDGILLCTDGLSGYLDDAGIERVLRSGATVQEIPKRLFDLALNQGSDDNITVQYLRYGKKPRARSSFKRFLFWTAVVVLAVPVLVGLFMAYGWYRENKITRLKQELTQVKEKYEVAGNQAQKLQDELAKLKNQLDNFEAERASIEQQINHLEQNIDQKTIESTEANSTTERLKKGIEEIERKLEELAQKKMQ